MFKHAIVGAALACLSVSPAFGWSEKDAKIGKSNHARILKQYGGQVENERLRAYIRAIGNRLVKQTGKYAKEPFTFTVLNSPIVNAFALPGGYVYITRGLLALANDEAEVAGVLGHEIAHITLRHSAGRQKRGEKAQLGVLVGTVLGAVLDGKEGFRKGNQLASTVAKGYVAQYSQKQEFESDARGQRYMAAAGYDPMGQAEFLASMAAKHKLESAIAGREYNPNQVDFFASHPATGERVRRARSLAEKVELRNLLREGEEDYLLAIDGMIYGDAPDQGFVRGRRFLHPTMRFGFEVPKGFRITNSSSQVISKGPKGTSFKLQDGGKAEGSPKDFITREWIPTLAKSSKIGKVSGLKSYNHDGLRAATAYMPVMVNGTRYVGQLTSVFYNGRNFLFTGIAPANDRQTQRALQAAARSFRALSSREASRLQPYRIRVTDVRRGDRVRDLMAGGAYGTRGTERFLTMNGIPSAEALQVGDLVKQIMP